MSERTDSDRVNAGVRLVIDYEDVDALVADYLDEISTGRLFVATERELPLSTKVQLVLSSPGLREPVGIAARVTGNTMGAAGEPGVVLQLEGTRGRGRQDLDQTIRLIQGRDPRVVSQVIRVLVVEDNPHILRIIQEGLRSASKKKFGQRFSFDVWKARSAAEAMSLLRSHEFALLIADIHLGGPTGTDVIEEVRDDPNLEAIPIIAISAGDESTRKRALDAGADAFIAKPMRLLHIVETMRRLLELQED